MVQHCTGVHIDRGVPTPPKTLGIAAWNELDSVVILAADEGDSRRAENASLAVMEENYFYVRVIATSVNLFSTCSLSADYVEITSLAEEAWDTGVVRCLARFYNRS